MKGMEIMTLLAEQEIPTEEAADALALTEEALLARLFERQSCSGEELTALKALLCLDDEEAAYLFYG